ncbi:MAG: hypothetical protein J0M18_00460 [Ignavibacteria bacterium]|jgi:ribosome-binding ATPase YchF (GTP1/OBG family)|nr:hypothetical protein [Ignavibacteria bacterium]
MNPLTASFLLTQFSKLIPKLLDIIKEIKISDDDKKIQDVRIKTTSYLETTKQMIVACNEIKGNRKLKNEKINEIFEALKKFQQSELLNIVSKEKNNSLKISSHRKNILSFYKLTNLLNQNSGVILTTLNILKLKLSRSNKPIKRYNIDSLK